jgi:hypothetical protein
LVGDLTLFALASDGRALPIDWDSLQLPFNDVGFNTTRLPLALAQWDSLGTGQGEFLFGEVLPAGLTREQLLEIFQVRLYVGANHSFGELGLTAIPEPSHWSAIVLAWLLIVGVVVVRRRKTRYA